MADIELLKEQNPWWIAREKITEDVNLAKLRNIPYKWLPAVMDSFNLKKDIIYTLRGSRQIGKTTLLKLLTEKLLENNPKENIFYFTCNTVDDHTGLVDILRTYLDWNDNKNRKYIFIDEITFVKDWTRGIKHLADIGFLQHCTIILTGSNSHDLKYETERMPGRRGQDPDLDKILFPVSFREFVDFAAPDITEKIYGISSAKKNYDFYKKRLHRYLDDFLLSGGFIQAINNLASNNKIDIDIYQQYLSWVLGDLVKSGKKESSSRQIFDQVINSITSNIGFDTIAKKTNIDSHLTVGGYLETMESSFIIKILYQVDLNKKLAASRKTKKIYFQDMFLFWVFSGYVRGLSDYFSGSQKRLKDPLLKSKLIENAIMSHLIRTENSLNWGNMIFFFRGTNQTEIDFIVRTQENSLLPIEVKYQRNITPRHFLQLDKINKQTGIIISKEDFNIYKNKWILPPELFLLLTGTERTFF